MISSSAYFLNPWALPILFSAILIPIITAVLLSSSRESNVNRSFLALSVLAGLWLLSYALMLSSTRPDVATTWAKFAYCFVGATMTAGYVFALVAVGKIEDRSAWLAAVGGSYLLVTAILFGTDRIVAGVYQDFVWGPYQKHGDLAFLHIGFQMAVGMLVFWEFWRDLRNNATNQSRKNRNRGFLLAIVLLGGATVDFLPAYGYEIYPLGYIPFLGCCAITAFTIWNYRLIDFTPAFAAREVLETLEDPLVVCDRKGEIRLVNDACIQLTEFSEDDLVGESLAILFPGYDKNTEEVSKFLRTLEKTNDDVTLTASDGTKIDVDLSVSNLTDQGDREVGCVILAHDIREQKEAQEQIQKLEFYHPITGLPNRKLFNQQVENRLHQSQAQDEIHALFYLSIDGFRELKGALGQEGTRTLLKQVSKRLELFGGDVMTLSHWSDNEFVLHYSDLNLNEIRERTEGWIQNFEDPFEIEDKSLHITVSVGIAVYPKHGEELDELISKADLAMTEARKERGHSVKIYEEGRLERTGKKVNLVHDLREVLEQDDLMIFYQPKIENITERVTGMEALLRWDHPSEGFISPERIVSLAEDAGLMNKMGAWIMRKACNQQRKWKQEYDESLTISVNISTIQFHHEKEFLRSLDSIIDETNIDPKKLEIEITETTAMKDIEFSKDILTEVKNKNVRVHIDDFGTGHSSMKYLMALPIDAIKIDKSFVLNLRSEPDNQALIKTMMSMARDLNLDVIAEGVETRDHLTFLSSHGCDYFQGYLWTKPLPSDKVTEYVENASDLEYS